MNLVVPGLGARTSSISVGIDINTRKLPTVFRYDGTGKNCYISGSYDDWKSKIPLVRRYAVHILGLIYRSNQSVVNFQFIFL